MQSARYYRASSPDMRFSKFLELFAKTKNTGFKASSIPSKDERLVDIVAYCLMPTHMHFILKQLKEGGISRFMANVQNSYSRYFNLKYDRNGPLWGGRFKNVLIDSQEYFSHLTCYIHLNPVSAGLTKRPEDWEFSSYREYCGRISSEEAICSHDQLLDMDHLEYQRFVEARIEDQRELGEIKHLLLE